MQLFSICWNDLYFRALSVQFSLRGVYKLLYFALSTLYLPDSDPSGYVYPVVIGE